MAKLLEHQGKGWLRAAGLPVPRGRAASTPEEAAAIAEELGCPVVVKAQLHAGGRGKSGGLAFADTPAQAALGASSLLGREFKGAILREVLVEEKLDIASYTANGGRDARCPMLMVSAEGGVDIESVPEENIFRLLASPTKGPDPQALRAALLKAGVPAAQHDVLAGFLADLFGAYRRYDCFTLEINPLVVTRPGDIFAADCKMEIDNSSVFRHPEMGIEVARDFGHERSRKKPSPRDRPPSPITARW